MKTTPYRQLSNDEIAQLKTNGCFAEDWSLIKITSEDFQTDHVYDVYFAGECSLGANKGHVILPSGLRLPAGVYRCSLYNCHIGDNCRIANIGRHISNYQIGESCLISDCSLLETNEESSFAQGEEIAVLNESGGREILLTDLLSAQTAYLMAMYRDRPKLQKKLRQLSKKRAEQKQSSLGQIGNGCRLLSCSQIKNVLIGNSAELEGCTLIEDCSIVSSSESPTKIGSGTTIKKTVIADGACVDDGAHIVHCFVGQACHISAHFSAENSLFFANSVMHNGESCAAFLGPHSISMHKANLLIGGYFSFSNSGSGSNQSNHYYRLGPIHHGIVERGGKLASDSYLLWPSRIGAFSLIKGRHGSGLDSADFPFSYLIGQDDHTDLKPGYMLGSIGLLRDAQKWSLRDKRKGELQDFISYQVLSPYTMGKVAKGLTKLRETKTERLSNQLSVSEKAKQRGIKLYTLISDYYLLRVLLKYLQGIEHPDRQISIELPSPQSGNEWCDLCGLLLPQTAVEELISFVLSDKCSTLQEINLYIQRLHHSYNSFEWAWYSTALKLFKGIDQPNLRAPLICNILRSGLRSLAQLSGYIYEDAQKEFASSMQVGFGIDGDISARQKDFQSVRSGNKTQEILDTIATNITEIFRQTTDYLQRISGEDFRAETDRLIARHCPFITPNWERGQ